MENRFRRREDDKYTFPDIVWKYNTEKRFPSREECIADSRILVIELLVGKNQASLELSGLAKKGEVFEVSPRPLYLGVEDSFIPFVAKNAFNNFMHGAQLEHFNKTRLLRSWAWRTSWYYASQHFKTGDPYKLVAALTPPLRYI